MQVLRKIKLENTPEEEYSSESVNSPMRCKYQCVHCTEADRIELCSKY